MCKVLKECLAEKQISFKKQKCSTFTSSRKNLASVVRQRVLLRDKSLSGPGCSKGGNTIHKIKFYLVDSAVFIHPLNNWALVVRSTFFYHTRWMVIYSLDSMMRLLFNGALIKKSGKVISEPSYSCGLSCLSVFCSLR